MTRRICSLLVLLALCWPAVSWGTSTFDTATVTRAQTGTTVDATLTVGSNSNRLLVAMVTTDTNTSAITMSYNAGSGGSWTSLGSQGTSPKVAVYCSIAPSTGSVTVRAAFGSACTSDCAVQVHSWYDADQTTGCDNFTSAASNSISVTTTSGDGISAAYISLAATGAVSGCTTSADTNEAWNNVEVTAHCLASGASTSITFTGSSSPAIAGVRVVQFSAGGGGTTPRMMLLGVGP